MPANRPTPIVREFTVKEDLSDLIDLFEKLMERSASE
jgi:hypothetical protein